MLGTPNTDDLPKTDEPRGDGDPNAETTGGFEAPAGVVDEGEGEPNAETAGFSAVALKNGELVSG